MKREEYTRYKQINNYNKGRNNTTYTNQTVEYYKKVEKNTISSNSGITNSRYNQYTSNASKASNANNKSSYNHNIQKGKTNSFSSTQKNLNNSYSSKQKFEFAEKVREKNNYIYYVSGVGYVNKNEENKNEKKVTKPKNPPPKPKERTNIKIQQTKNISDMRKELLDNYQYHETKDLRKEAKQSVVTHRRLCEPVYTTIQKNSKKYSSHTEQPINKSYQRKEYEIIETRKPVQQTTKNNNININYRIDRTKRENQTQIQNRYNINNANKISSRSVKHYNNINENKRQNSFTKRDDKDNNKNNYVYNRREISVDTRRNYIRSDNINNTSNRNYQRENKINNTTTITTTNQTRISNRNYNRNQTQTQNYNNLQRHEIRAVSKDKVNNTNNNYSKGRSNITESRRQYTRITRDQKPNQSTNQNTRINRRNVYESRTQEINNRIKNVYNSVNNNRNTVEAFEHRGNYFPLEAVRPIEHMYELNRGVNIPQQMEQIAIYEGGRNRMENLDEAYPSNVEIDFNQISQNIPQQVQEIAVHEKMENIPQHVQQIEVYEGNHDGENMEQNIEKNDNEDIDNNNMEEENIQQNLEQNEEIKDEQEIFSNNQVNQEIEIENKETLEEHEEKNIDLMQNHEQNNSNEVEQNIENIDDIEEKEGNLQLENNIQMEEEFEEENKNDKLQVQKIDYDHYIPGQNIKPFTTQENIAREEELYQINQSQFINERLNNEQNYTNFCPIHGIYHTPYNQNIIYDMQNQYQKNRNMFEIGEDGMVVGNTDNYKFYESKNLKNEGENNSYTLHHLRGEEKFMNSNNNTANNIYVATKVVPILTESNYSNFEEINNRNNINHDIENIHSHDENCPIHGDKNIQSQNK